MAAVCWHAVDVLRLEEEELVQHGPLPRQPGHLGPHTSDNCQACRKL